MVFIKKALLVIDQFCGGNPELGISISDSLILGTLKQSGLIESVECFYYDNIGVAYGIDMMSEMLLDTCKLLEPDLVIFSPMVETLDPKKEIIGYIKDTLHIPVVGYFYDSVQRYPYVKGWLSFLTNAIVIDSSVGWYRLSRENKKLLLGYTAINQQHFYDRKLTKDIDVIFIGSLTSNNDRWPHRKEYVNYLLDNGIPLTVAGGQQIGSPLSTDEYASLISRSKISINFSKILPELDQVKGRVFETMASNTFLLEESGTETKLFLEEGTDYISFSSKEELLEQVCYYLENSCLRDKITKNGFDIVSSVYNSCYFWAYVLSVLGFFIPEKTLQSDGYNQLVRKLKHIQSEVETRQEEFNIREYPRVAIFGASTTGEQYLRQCRQQGVEVMFFLDNATSRETIDGLPILQTASVDIEEIEKSVDAIILASAGRFLEMKNQLIGLGFKKKIIEYF